MFTAEQIKSTEMLNPRRNYIAVAVFTYYNTSQNIAGVVLFKTYHVQVENNFSEMKGDVGMSCHEKEGEKEYAYMETGNY